MGDQTMRQAPPVRKSRPATKCRVLFRVIDRLSQWIEVENYAVAIREIAQPHCAPLLGRFAALIGRR
jgi:hypothetical protein